MAELKYPSFILWVDYKIILKSQLSILNSFLGFEPSFSLTSIYKRLDFIGNLLKTQYVFSKKFTNKGAMLVNKIILKVNKTVLLVNKIILKVNKIVLLVNKIILLDNKAIKTYNIAVLLVNKIILKVNKIVLKVNKIILLDNIAALLVNIATKTYWVFALFTHKLELFNLKYKQMAISAHRICDDRNIFTPSEKLLLIHIYRPDYRDRQ
jgi:hypothetical protein